MAGRDSANRSSPRMLAWLALAFAAVILVSINLLATQYLSLWRADVTQNKLYTITRPTRSVLSGLGDTVDIKLFYSRALGEQAAAYAAYAARVKNLLAIYKDLAHGKLDAEVIDPEPFSDAEDAAVGAGLQGVNLNGGVTGYFGIIGSNLTDDQETIAFLNLDRAQFLEYDLTRMVLKLSDPKRKVIGLLSGVNPQGGMDEQGRMLKAWTAITQLQDFYQVEDLTGQEDAVPADVDALLLLSPDDINDKLAESIDQFALSGKPVMVFADPYSEVRRIGKARLKPKSNLARLLQGWGAVVAPDEVVGDITNSRQVQYGSAAQPKTANYVVWMTLGKEQFDPHDPLFANVDRLVFATPGSLTLAKGATTRFEPLITTSPEAMLIGDTKLVPPDPARLLELYKPGGTPLTLAAHLTGPAKASFDAGAKGLKDGKVNVIVVSDADMLFDSFWAEQRKVMGQTFLVPRANNADLLLNGMEELVGGEALAGLRGRGVEARPFTRIEELQAAAEQKFRAREQELNKKLEDTQTRLKAIQSRSKDGQIILSEDDKKELLGFRQEFVQTRKDLRLVRRELNADIERLQSWIMFLDIAAIPLLIVLGGLLFALFRRVRRTSA